MATWLYFTIDNNMATDIEKQGMNWYLQPDLGELILFPVISPFFDHENKMFFCFLLAYVPDKKSEILGVRYNEVCTFNVLMKLCVGRFATKKRVTWDG
jgi:hypothetical protein